MSALAGVRDRRTTAPLPRVGSSWSTIRRVVEHRALQYRRTFRASIFSSFGIPALFLTAMGLGLGGYVDRSQDAVLHGLTYLQFLEDSYATASSFRKSGSWIVQAEPDADPIEV